MSSPSGDISQLLGAWADGDRAALEALMPIVYKELQRLAHRYMACERPGHSLQTTALVNEAYLKLVDCGRVRWQNRMHFFAVSAQLMRRILVDFARSHRYQKRSAGARKITFDEDRVPARCQSFDLLALDEALGRLGTLDVRNISAQTVWRDWTFARSWLQREMKRGQRRDGGTMGADRALVSLSPRHRG